MFAAYDSHPLAWIVLKLRVKKSIVFELATATIHFSQPQCGRKGDDGPPIAVTTATVMLTMAPLGSHGTSRAALP